MADKLKKVIDKLDEAADSFDGIANKEQKKIFDEVILLAKDLDTDIFGRVKQSIGNLKRLTAIKSKLAALSKDKEWVDGIAGFARYFGELQRLQNDFYSANFPQQTLSARTKEKNDLLRQMAVQNTMEALMGDGLKANVTDKLNDILLRAVTTGAKFADLQEELRGHLLGKDGGQGAFARYATTYATTALSQYTGQHNKLMTDDLGTEWFMYIGSNKETTREFCEHLTAKKYVHKSEIPEILKGKIEYDGKVHECAIYAKTQLPYGMIAGTTPENFQCNCGGWNCRHQLVPVADAVVPKQIRDRLRLQQKLEQANKPIEKENRLYLSFVPFSNIIAEKLEYLHKRKEQQSLFKEIINDESFDLQFRVGEHKTVVHPDNDGKTKSSWKGTLGMARDINRAEGDVAFLPERRKKGEDNNGVNPVDAVAPMFGDYAIVEFKYSESNVSGTVKDLLEDGFNKSKNVAIKVTKMDYSNFCDAVDYLLRNKHNVGNLKLINRNGKIINISEKDIRKGRYKKQIRGFL